MTDSEDALYAETLGALDMLELVLYCDAMDAERPWHLLRCGPIF